MLNIDEVLSTIVLVQMDCYTVIWHLLVIAMFAVPQSFNTSSSSPFERIFSLKIIEKPRLTEVGLLQSATPRISVLVLGLSASMSAGMFCFHITSLNWDESWNILLHTRTKILEAAYREITSQTKPNSARGGSIYRYYPTSLSFRIGNMHMGFYQQMQR